MTTIEQAYAYGFVKRAMQYGYTEDQAIEILKTAGPLESATTLTNNPGAKTYTQAGLNPEHAVAPAPAPGVSAISPEMAKKLRIPVPPAQQAAPAVDPANMNDLGMFTPR